MGKKSRKIYELERLLEIEPLPCARIKIAIDGYIQDHEDDELIQGVTRSYYTLLTGTEVNYREGRGVQA